VGEARLPGAYRKSPRPPHCDKGCHICILQDRYRLTPAQVRVFALLVMCLPDKRIASILGLANRTIKSHTQPIYNKLGLDNRLNLVLWAHAQGMIG
jgi:two-component system response regulator DevR